MAPPKSYVWQFMERIDMDFVQCKLCQAQYTANSGTSTMRKHLEVKHAEEAKRAEAELKNAEVAPETSERSWSSIEESHLNEEEYDDDYEEDWSITKRKLSGVTKCGMKRKNASVIWELMVRVSPTEIKCEICQRVFNFDGSTSNLHRHFRKDHPSEFGRILEGKKSKTLSSSSDSNPWAVERPTASTVGVDIDEQDEACENIESMQRDRWTESLSNTTNNTTSTKVRQKRTLWGMKRKNASVVWKLMVKVNAYEASCQLCKKVFRYDGSTSNMNRHLHRDHPEELAEVQNGGTITLPANSPDPEPNGAGEELDEDNNEESLSDEECADFSGGNSPDQWKQRRAMRPNYITGLRRKNESIVWKFMKKADSFTAVCQICNKPFSYEGSTSNMIRHLKTTHAKEFAEGEENGTSALAVIKQEDTESETFHNESPVNGNHLNENRRLRYFSPAKSHLAQKKTTSIVWKFMTRINPGEIRCEICKKEFSFVGKTPNMRKHLKFAHPAQYFKALTAARTQNSHKFSERSTKRFSQFPPAQAKRGPVELEQLVLMAVGNLRPCSLDLVGSESFLKFMHTMDSSFVAPDKNSMETMVSDLHRKQLDLLKLQLADIPGMSVSIEIWTYRDRQRYMTVTVHFVSDAWEIQSRVLKTVSLESLWDMSQCIADKLEQLLQELDILDKVKCIVGNDTDLLSLAVTKLSKRYLQCMAHSLNRIVLDSWKTSGHFEYLVTKIRKIASFFLYSTEAAKTLSVIQSGNCNDKEPLQFVLYRESDWIGTFKMLQCYLKLHGALRQALDKINEEDILLTVEEVEAVTCYVQVLEPFSFAAGDMISDSYTCLSKSLPVLEILHQMTENLANKHQSLVDNQSESVIAFVKTINNMTEQCLATVRNKENFLPWAAALLDPRFKHIVIENEVMFKWVESELQTMMKPKTKSASVEVDPKLVPEEDSRTAPKPSSTETDNFNLLWSSFDASIKKYTREEPVNELHRYVEEFVISRQEDPFAWWKERGHLYPTLSNIVKQFLCIPATQGPANEFFSEQEIMKKNLRNFLEEPQIDAIMFLNSWQKHKSKR